MPILMPYKNIMIINIQFVGAYQMIKMLNARLNMLHNANANDIVMLA